MRLPSVIIFAVVVLTAGCLPSYDECDVDKSKAALQSNRGNYRNEVLQNLAKYEKLKDFILLHLDTLLIHNQKRCISSIKNVGGKRDTLFCEPPSSITLYNYGDGNMIKDQIPAHLYAGFMALNSSINTNKSHTVSFERDGLVFIFLTNEQYDEDRIKVLHMLEWNSKMDRSNLAPLEKDTLLANGARYVIYTDCYRGH